MQWKSANIDGVPDHDRQVLLCVNGVYHIGRYNRTLKGFKLHEGSYFLPDHSDISWLEVPGLDSETAQDLYDRSHQERKS